MTRNEWILFSINKIILLTLILIFECFKFIDLISIIGTITTLIALLFAIKITTLQYEAQWFELQRINNKILSSARQFFTVAEYCPHDIQILKEKFQLFRERYYENYSLLKESGILKNAKFLDEIQTTAIELYSMLETNNYIFKKPYIQYIEKSLYELHQKYPENSNRENMIYSRYCHDEYNKRKLYQTIKEYHQKRWDFREIIYGCMKNSNDQFEFKYDLHKKSNWAWQSTLHCLTWGLLK